MNPISIAITIIASLFAFITILIILIRLCSGKIFFHRVEGDVHYHFQSIRDFPNLKQDNVSIAKNKKINLNGGLYYYPNRKYKGLIIFYHGFLSGRLNYLNVIEFFARHDYQVLAFDFLGTMSSEGKSIRGMPNVTSDIPLIINYAIKNEAFKDLPIYTVGHSMGGYSALISLLYEDKRIKKSIAFCPYNSNVSCTYSLNPILKIFGPLVFLYNLIFFGYRASYKAVDALKYSDAKKMIICGGKDEIVRPQYAYKNFKKVVDKKKDDGTTTLIYIPDGDHFVYMSKEGAKNFTDNISFPRKGPILFDKIKYEQINAINEKLFKQILEFLDK